MARAPRCPLRQMLQADSKAMGHYCRQLALERMWGERAAGPRGKGSGSPTRAMSHQASTEEVGF